MDTTEILAHPLAGLDYDRYYDPNFKDEAQRKLIKEKVIDKYGARIKKIIEAEGYPSYAEFYKDKLATALIKVASAQTKGQRIKYRTTDFKTNEYSLQIGALPYEPEERNPMMGYRGIYRMLHPDYIKAFELEIEAIKKAREVQTNIDVMFPVVRTPEELKEAVDLLAKHGLVRGKDFKIGMMVEVPSNIFQAAEFYKYVDFMSIGSNDLTQFTLGIGRDNNKMAPFADEANPAVKKGLEIVIKTANIMKVISGFCGQRPSNDPDFAGFLVEVGIVSISVVPDVFDQVANKVDLAEKKLEGMPFNPNITGWEIPEKDGNPQRIVGTRIEASNIIKNMGIHPQVLLSYDKGQVKDAGLKKEIEGRFAGKTAEQYVIDKVYQELIDKAKSTPSDVPIIYSTDDLDKTVYETLLGGKELESFDENPTLGFCGLARVVDPEYQKFFRWQLEAIKKARQDSGRSNIGIRLNLARILPEVSTALNMAKEAGLIPGQDGFRVGMEIDFPSNVLLINEFIGLGINFLSENNERFLSYDMGTDPGSQYVQYSDKAKEIALRIPRRVWTNAAEKAKIPLVQDANSFIRAADSTVYQATDQGFDNMVNSLKGLTDTKGAFVIGADTIFKNAGTISVIRKIKEAKTGLKVAVWAADKATVETLKVMGIEEVADIISPEGLSGALNELDKIGIPQERIAVFYSVSEPVSSIRKLFDTRPDIKVISVAQRSGDASRLNSMSLIFARAIAGIFQNENTVVEKFKELSQNYKKSRQITEQDYLSVVKDLTAQISTVPLVQLTKEKDKEVIEAQITYEETVGEI